MSYYDDDGYRQSRRIHGLGVQSPQEPMPRTETQEQPPSGTNATGVSNTPTQPTTIEENSIIDFLSDDSYSFETQSFRAKTRPPSRQSHPLMTPVPPPYAPRQSPSPSSGSVTSVYVQADPPAQQQTQRPIPTFRDWSQIQSNQSQLEPTAQMQPQPEVHQERVSTTPSHGQIIQPTPVPTVHHQHYASLQHEQQRLQQEVQSINNSIARIDTTMNTQYTALLDKLNMLITSQSLGTVNPTSQVPSTRYQQQPLATMNVPNVTPRTTNVAFQPTTSVSGHQQSAQSHSQVAPSNTPRVSTSTTPNQ